jgi:hypothetical protein
MPLQKHIHLKILWLPLAVLLAVASCKKETATALPPPFPFNLLVGTYSTTGYSLQYAWGSSNSPQPYSASYTFTYGGSNTLLWGQTVLFYSSPQAPDTTHYFNFSAGLGGESYIKISFPKPYNDSVYITLNDAYDPASGVTYTTQGKKMQ